jgi:hypothetical protein
MPPRIRIENTVVMLNPGSQLYLHHLEGSRNTVDFSKPFAEVTRHPADASRLGLKNLGDQAWTATIDGDMHEVPPTRSVALGNGTRIHFGKAEGEVRA